MPHKMQQLLLLCFLMTLPLLDSQLCPSADRDREPQDLTIKDCATGNDVVRATMAKIRAAGLLNSVSHCGADCYQFLERIAYAESSVRSNCGDGGIWRVKERHFRRQSRPFFELLLEMNHSLAVELNKPIINIPTWTSIQFENLTKPLYSAVAAAMFLAQRELFDRVKLMTRDDQARTWSQLYTTSGGTRMQFSDAVNQAMESEYVK